MKVNGINAVECVKNHGKSEHPSNLKNEKHPQIKELSNICYKPLSFGRTWAEHKSWGAVINPKTKEASFKIFAYPDTEKVTVTVEKNSDKDKQQVYELKNKGAGVFEINDIPKGQVENGDKYYYTIYRPNQDPVQVKDPYSFRQEQLLNQSTIYDHSLYKWNDENWYKNNDRISRLANKENGLKTLNEAKIYEFNTASLTKDGTFESTKQKLDEIKQLGFNAIEIMPVENTYSFNWGYDGVDKLAPSEHLGGPDQLKDLIDTAHQKGLNVIMDMVPNHLGPDGAQLGKTGPYLSHSNDFGDAFNYEGKDSKYVKDFMVNAALNWLDNYHCDGLRLDMTKYMESDYTMKQIAAEVNYHKPDAFLIAEDARDDYRVTNPIKPVENGQNQPQKIHAQAMDMISNNQTSIDNLGFDSEWDFNYFHNLKDILYEVNDLNSFENACLKSAGKVKYTMSHDEIGNYDGTRLIAKLMVSSLNLTNAVELDDEDKERAKKLSEHKHVSQEAALWTVQCQKAQLKAEELAVKLQTGELDKYIGKDYHEFADDILGPMGIKYNSNLYYDRIKHAYDDAYDKNKMGHALTYVLPGPKMVFQGDEKADLTPFRFFREFDFIKDEKYLYWEKGYKYGKSALNESKMGNIPYSQAGLEKTKAFENLTKDLNKLSSENSAMTKGTIISEDTVKHHYSKVMGLHTKDFENGNELYTVINTNGNRYPASKQENEYMIEFPEGKWVQILNTNDNQYGGNGKFMNNKILTPNEEGRCSIKIDTHSTIIFKRID